MTSDTGARLEETKRAFDSIATSYDADNPFLRRMRDAVWRVLDAEMPRAGRLLDLGCGPGLDAIHMVDSASSANSDRTVVAMDWSPRMVEVTRASAARAGVSARVTAVAAGIHDVAGWPEGVFDGIYSDFGPLNCVPDLGVVARACAARLPTGAPLVVCMMGRHVPWEWIHIGLSGGRERSRARRAPEGAPVPLNQHEVWTAYYTPREVFEHFAPWFILSGYRGLGLFLPPPYLAPRFARWPRLGASLGALDDRLAALPLLRNAGDHFVLRMKRGPKPVAARP